MKHASQAATATYHAKKPCRICGSTLRYRSDRHCVPCRLVTRTAQFHREAAVWRNTYLALYYPDHFDRLGTSNLRNTIE